MTDVVARERAAKIAYDQYETEYEARPFEECKAHFIAQVNPIISAYLAALNEAGYVVGPLNATLEMCRAGHRSDLLGCDIPDDECEMYYSRVYAAMLSAAQPAPK